MAEKITVILRIVTICLHVMTVGFLVIVASLSVDAYFCANKLRGHTGCFFYMSALFTLVRVYFQSLTKLWLVGFSVSDWYYYSEDKL